VGQASSLSNERVSEHVSPEVAPRLPEGSHVASAHGNQCLVIPRVASRRLKMLQLNWIHCSAKSAFEAALISHFKPTAICFSACQFSF